MIKLMMSSVAAEDGTDMKEEDDSDGDEDYVRVHDMFSRIMQFWNFLSAMSLPLALLRI